MGRVGGGRLDTKGFNYKRAATPVPSGASEAARPLVDQTQTSRWHSPEARVYRASRSRRPRHVHHPSA